MLCIVNVQLVLDRQPLKDKPDLRVGSESMSVCCCMAWLLSRPAISQYTILSSFILYNWLEKESPEPTLNPSLQFVVNLQQNGKRSSTSGMPVVAVR